MTPRRIRVLSLLAAPALAAAPLMVMSPAAHAAPVFIDLQTGIDAETLAHDDAACAESNQVQTPNVSVPLVENGPAFTYNGVGSITNDGPVGDKMTGQVSASITASISSAGGNPKSIDATIQGSASTTSTLPTSSCVTHVAVDADLEFQFTVAQAGFLTVHLSRKGLDANSELDLEQILPTEADGDESEEGEAFDIDQTTRIYLTPGTYEGSIDIGISRSTNHATTAGPSSAAVHATFAVAGSQSEAATGKGGAFVTLPSARSCATHALTPTVTAKKKKAAKIKQVAFYVNDAKVKTVKHPKKGTVVSLPVADDVDSELRAVVQLLPKKKGRPAKELETTSSYVACTS